MIGDDMEERVESDLRRRHEVRRAARLIELRDYFAGQALAGSTTHRAGWDDYGQMARAAYDVADAMLAERGDV